jgi:hypothetical protein
MTQERTFTLNLKNDQQIVLKFSPISATGDRLWQMFATTEALDTVDQIIAIADTPAKPVAKNKLPTKKVDNKKTTKPAVKSVVKTSKKK